MIETLPTALIDVLQYTFTELTVLTAGVTLLALALFGALAMTTDVGRPDPPRSPGPELEQPDEPELAGDEVLKLSEVAVEEPEEDPAIEDDTLWMQGHRTAVGEWYATRRRQKKRRKLAKKGYVEWHLVNGSYPTPKFVKPQRTGAGVPEHREDGQVYIFPEEAALPSEHSGMPVYVHKAGEMDPVNLRDPVDHAISPDQFGEYVTMSLQTSSPGWLSNIDFWELMMYLGGGFVVLAVANEAFNLGLF